MAGTVLCVEDDRNLCQIVAKALGGAGYRVRTAFDGDDALASFDEDPPDLVLLDVILPRRDGFSVLEAIRQRPGPESETPVVLLSGSSPTPEYERRAVALGAADLLTKPVPLELLLSAVGRQIGELKSAVPADSARERTGRGAEGLAGSFDRLPFPALLHHLHGLRATGVLHLASGKKRKWIQFRDGYPVAVRGNLVNETLGNMLVRRGRLSPAVVAESRRRMRNGGLQGEILIAMDALTEQEMALALRAQAEQKLFEIFSWEGGSFRFDIGALLQRANALPVERSPANLILTGVRKRLPAARVEAFFEANASARLAAAERSFYRFQDLDLDDDQQALLRRLDGSPMLSEFRAADEEVRRTLYGLVATGLLELRSPAAARPAAAHGRRPAPPRAAARPAEAPDDDRLRAELAAMVERFRRQNHFEVLGVTPSASEEEIREAHVRLAARTHPDRVATSTQAVKKLAARVFAAIERAADVLADPRQRQAYLLDLRRAEREASERDEGRQALEAEKHFQRGEAALRQKDYPEALLRFGKALELYSEEGEYHAYYGWALHLSHPEDPNMAREAIDHLRRAIKLAGHREKPYLFMGRLCKVIERPDAAEKMFQRAVQIQPDCAEALSELRLIELRRRKSRGLLGRLLGR